MKIALVESDHTGNMVPMCSGHFRDYLGHLGKANPGLVMFGEGECRGCKTNRPHPQRDSSWPTGMRPSRDPDGRKRMASVRKTAHDSGDGATIFHCLRGETRFLTPDGIRTLEETAGQEVLVLTGDLDDSRGRWAPAHIHSFGRQRLWAVTLRRNKQTKVLYATDGHRWLMRSPTRVLMTRDLRAGQSLAHIRMGRYSGVLDHEGIRHGFHFGDGTVQVRGERTYGVVTLWGPKRDLADYFREVARAEYETVTEGGVEGLRFTSGMKDYRKELPSLHMPAEYLYGWLAGYVAADGSVSRTGQVTLSSAIRENLERLRDIATLLGIGTYGITGKMRKGFGDQSSMLFQIGLSAADLPEEFFLRDDHRERCNPDARERFGWTVVSVKETDRVEEVYCAVVPGTESFALEDNIHTGNCPFCFTESTEYITESGTRSFGETVGTTQRVLTSDGFDRHEGRWVDAEIRSFGVQPVMRVTLRRNKRQKEIETTAGHIWYVTSGPGRSRHREVQTQDLRPGHRLSHLRPQRVRTTLSREGVRAGLIFGDGSVARRNGRTYAQISLYGMKAKYLSEYFTEIGSIPRDRMTPKGVAGVRFGSQLFDYTKELPSLTEDTSYLYGWLAGYFAADGTVDRFGKASLSSAVREHLEYIRTLAQKFGIGTYGITTKSRKGYGTEESPLYEVAFATSDLEEDFFLRGDHQDSFRLASKGSDRFGWTVVSVEETGREEEVYCAVVPETHSFVLADNIWVHNCGSGQVIARSDRTTECEFCHAAFTVQVQPKFLAYPQTIDGMPMQVPGMPGQIGGPPAAPQPGMDPSMDPMGGQVPGAPGEEPHDPEEGLDAEGSDSDDDAPPWAKNSMLRTANGASLNWTNYLRHLAIKYADDKDSVIDRIREERR